jgi:hypothetical protein
MHGRHPDATDDRGRRQRKLDLPQQVARSHPHRDSHISNRRADGGDADDRRPDDRQQGVEDERNHGSASANAAEKWHRQQESEHRQAGDGLHDIRDRDERFVARRGPSRREHTERHTEAGRDRGGDRDQETCSPSMTASSPR